MFRTQSARFQVNRFSILNFTFIALGSTFSILNRINLNFTGKNRPKIGKAQNQSDTLRRHTKGCNCKRSGCLKNYCECYEAKIVCSANCKCIGKLSDTIENSNLISELIQESNVIIPEILSLFHSLQKDAAILTITWTTMIVTIHTLK